MRAQERRELCTSAHPPEDIAAVRSPTTVCYGINVLFLQEAIRVETPKQMWYPPSCNNQISFTQPHGHPVSRMVFVRRVNRGDL